MTATAPSIADPYRQRFAEFLANRREPDSLTGLRRAAFARFESLGLPTRRQEAWRSTDLGPLQAVAWNLPTTAPVEVGSLPDLGQAARRLVFVNGRYAPALSQGPALPDGVTVTCLSQAAASQTTLVESSLDQAPGLDRHPFAALNAAFWEDGAFVHLPRGAVLETPIHLIFVATGHDALIHPRLLAVLEDGAQATVVVEYRGQGRYLNAPVAELTIGDGAVLHYHQIQDESPQAFHLGAIGLRQGRDSQAQAHLFADGGQVTRTDLTALLDGEGAHCALDGLTLGHDSQYGDFHVRVEHAYPHGTSEQLFKSVLDGKAQAMFDGMIHVRPHAQKSDARQLSRNLLLSRQAQAHSIPRLEILADDVKCGHGSSTGFLDPDAEFYLRARGIPASAARALLVYAFANDNLNRIGLTPLRERLGQVLADRLALLDGDAR